MSKRPNGLHPGRSQRNPRGRRRSSSPPVNAGSGKGKGAGKGNVRAILLQPIQNGEV